MTYKKIEEVFFNKSENSNLNMYSFIKKDTFYKSSQNGDLLTKIVGLGLTLLPFNIEQTSLEFIIMGLYLNSGYSCILLILGYEPMTNLFTVAYNYFYG